MINKINAQVKFLRKFDVFYWTLSVFYKISLNYVYFNGDLTINKSNGKYLLPNNTVEKFLKSNNGELENSRISGIYHVPKHKGVKLEDHSNLAVLNIEDLLLKKWIPAMQKSYRQMYF